MTRRLKSISIPHDENGAPRRSSAHGETFFPREKNLHNPTIVTVIGGGLAGLAAAHELVERGFLVQVVEKEASQEYPGEVDLGGMARSQYGRVKPAIDHLHSEIVERSHAGDERASLLLKLIHYTRRPFVQTASPVPCQLIIEFDTPEPAHLELAKDRTEKPPGKIKHISHPFTQPVAEEAGASFFDRCVEGLWSGLLARRRQFLFNLTSTRHKKLKRALRWLQQSETLDGPTNGFIANIERNGVLDRRSDEDHKAATEPEQTFEAALLDEISRHLERNNEAAYRLPKSRPWEQWMFDALAREIMYVELRGHASTDGRPTLNQQISLARANVLRQKLGGTARRAEWKVLERHVTVVGMGELEPITRERTEQERGQNRRAEVVVIERLFPGEHGFRVFPRHYWNTFDIMQRIPLHRNSRGDGNQTVLDALRPTTIQALGMHRKRLKSEEVDTPHAEPAGAAPLQPASARPPREYSQVTDSHHVQLLRRRPNSLEELRWAISQLFPHSGIEPKDVMRQQLKVFQVLTMSKARRWKELDEISWKEYLGIGTSNEGDIFGRPRYSPAMVEQITSAAQALLAYSAAEADAHSYGNFAAQLVADQLTDGEHIDRLLTGPTSETWILPWKRYLEDQGVRFFQGELEGLCVRPAGPSSDTSDELLPIWKGKVPQPEDGRGHRGPAYLDFDELHPGCSPDFYVLALPPDRINEIAGRLKREYDGQMIDTLVDKTAARDIWALLRFGEAELGNSPKIPVSKGRIKNHEHVSIEADLRDDLRTAKHEVLEGLQKIIALRDQAKRGSTGKDAESTPDAILARLRKGDRVEKSHPLSEHEVVAEGSDTERDLPSDASAQKWMSGLQFFYEAPVSLAQAHVYYPQSRWGISAVSQTQFWNNRPSQALGFLGVTSIDICTWNSASMAHVGDQKADFIYHRPAVSLPPLDIAIGSWIQVCESGSSPTISVRQATGRGYGHDSVSDDLQRKSGGRDFTHHLLQAVTELKAQLEKAQFEESRPGEEACLAAGNGAEKPPVTVQVPDVFHLDSGLWTRPDVTLPFEEELRIHRNRTKYLAARQKAYALRPGLLVHGGVENGKRVEHPVIYPAINYGRWVLAGSFMATYTRMMTMEASIESGRRAAARILERRDRGHSEQEPNQRPDSRRDDASYNGRRPTQMIQFPRIYDVESEEIPELEPLKRLDERLCEANLPHIFEILQLESRLDVFVTLQETMRKQRELDLDLDGSALSKALRHSLTQAMKDWPVSPELESLGEDTESGRRQLRKVVDQIFSFVDLLGNMEASPS